MSYNEQALAHHGIKGMRWGHRRFQNADGSLTPAGRHRYADNPKESRKTQRLKGERDAALERAKKTDAKANEFEARGNSKKASFYRDLADFERIDADDYGSQLQKSQREDKFRATRKDISASRKTGHKLATNLIAGPFANRTYNSVIAAGGSRAAAAGITIAANLVGGPIGHLAVSALYTKSAGDGNLSRDFD